MKSNWIASWVWYWWWWWCLLNYDNDLIQVWGLPPAHQVQIVSHQVQIVSSSSSVPHSDHHHQHLLTTRSLRPRGGWQESSSWTIPNLMNSIERAGDGMVKQLIGSMFEGSFEEVHPVSPITLGFDYRGKPTSREEEVVMNWANNQDRKDWKEGGFRLKDVMAISRMLGMDGQFIKTQREGLAFKQYFHQMFHRPHHQEEFKLIEILIWFSNRLQQTEFERRLQVFSFLTLPSLTPTQRQAWWNEIEIEQWIKRTDWDLDLILKIGLHLRLYDDQNVIWRNEEEVNFTRNQLIQLLDPMRTFKQPPTIKNHNIALPTYLPEALAVGGPPYRIGSLYQQRINLLTQFTKSDLTQTQPEMNDPIFRTYWIARGVDPSLAFKVPDFRISSPGFLIFKNFGTHPKTFDNQLHRSKGFKDLISFGLEATDELLRHLWDHLATLRPS